MYDEHRVTMAALVFRPRPPDTGQVVIPILREKQMGPLTMYGKGDFTSYSKY